MAPSTVVFVPSGRDPKEGFRNSSPQRHFLIRGAEISRFGPALGAVGDSRFCRFRPLQGSSQALSNRFGLRRLRFALLAWPRETHRWLASRHESCGLTEVPFERHTHEIRINGSDSSGHFREMPVSLLSDLLQIMAGWFVSSRNVIKFQMRIHRPGLSSFCMLCMLSLTVFRPLKRVVITFTLREFSQSFIFA
jgi:hypothetical protein